MKRPSKPPLSLALQRAQVALHEAGIEVGRLQDIEERIKIALRDWRTPTTVSEVLSMPSVIIIPANPELWSLLPPKN